MSALVAALPVGCVLALDTLQRNHYIDVFMATNLYMARLGRTIAPDNKDIRLAGVEMART